MSFRISRTVAVLGLLLAGSVLILSGPLHAQTDAPPPVADAPPPAIAETPPAAVDTPPVAAPVPAASAAPVVLPPVVVTGSRPGYDKKRAGTSTKTDTPLIETPMAIGVITRKTLDDQQAIRPRDALRNVSGVQSAFGFGALRDRSIIRGFETDEFPQGGSYLDGMLQFEAVNSLANIESVEVLKGSSAMLYGRIEPGGLINYVTKRPQADSDFSVQQQVGSWSNYRTTLDGAGPLNEDRTLLYRLNAEWIDSRSFRDTIYVERQMIAPSFTLNLSPRTTLDLDLVYQYDETPGDNGLPAISNGVADVPVSRFVGDDSNRATTRVFQGAVTLSHALDEAWKLKARLAHYDMNGHFLETQLLRLDPPDTDGIGPRWVYEAPNGIRSAALTVDVTGRFEVGGVQHTLLLGADTYERRYNEDGKYADVDFNEGGVFPPPINIFSPQYGYDIEAVLAAQTRAYSFRLDRWWGVYAQDQLGWGPWRLLVGGRFDHAVSGRSDNAERQIVQEVSDARFSPRVGVLHLLNSQSSVFANYSESFNRPNLGSNAADGSPLNSQTSRQLELGFKADVFDEALAVNVAIFDLTKRNIANRVGPPSSTVFDLSGEQRSRGLEVDLRGRIAAGWDAVLAYAYTRALATRDAQNEGKPLTNVPRHSGSAWLNHAVAGLPGLSLAAGVIAQSSRSGAPDNSFTLPSFIRWDAALAYSSQLWGRPALWQFQIENLADERYFVSSGSDSYQNRVSTTPGAPRNALASLKLEF